MSDGDPDGVASLGLFETVPSEGLADGDPEGVASEGDADGEADGDRLGVADGVASLGDPDGDPSLGLPDGVASEGLADGVVGSSPSISTSAGQLVQVLRPLTLASSPMLIVLV